MAKLRRSMEERRRRWHHVTELSEDLLAGVPDLRESVEEPRELSAEIRRSSRSKTRPPVEDLPWTSSCSQTR
jgi:hypothetical protein